MNPPYVPVVIREGRPIKSSDQITGELVTPNGTVRFSAHTRREIRVTLIGAVVCNGRPLNIIAEAVHDKGNVWKTHATAGTTIVDTTSSKTIDRQEVAQLHKNWFTRKAVDDSVREVRQAWIDYVAEYPEVGRDILRRCAANREDEARFEIEGMQATIGRRARIAELYERVKCSDDPAKAWDEIDAKITEVYGYDD
jgi:hypothetical protein